MIRTFSIFNKINLTEKQNDAINKIIETINTYDVHHEVEEMFMPAEDINNGTLNDEFCPIILTNSKYTSDELYEAVITCSYVIPEFDNEECMMPLTVIPLWKRE